MKYKVVSRETHSQVVEVKTKLLIQIFQNIAEAKKLVKILNSGSGFRGFTPPFFIKKIV